jgi:hypothetical protein
MEILMIYSDSERFKKRDEVLLQELGGEAVLLDLGGGRYYGLDEVGLRIYQLITSSHSISETCDVLLQEFDVQPMQLRGDLEGLLTDLLKAGLLEKSNA